VSIRYREGEIQCNLILWHAKCATIEDVASHTDSNFKITARMKPIQAAARPQTGSGRRSAASLCHPLLWIG